MIAARYLNSIADPSNYSWPREPAQMLLTRLDGINYTTKDLVSAYNRLLFQMTPRNYLVSLLMKNSTRSNGDFTAYAVLQFSLVESLQYILLKLLPRSKLSHLFMV